MPDRPSRIVAVRRLLTWLAGLAGVAALARLLRRKETAVPRTAVETPDPATELRRKLAETREQAAEPAVADEPVGLDERRARVHAQAQEAIDLMRPGDAAPEGGDDAVA
jgi:hypothetical protein